MKRPNKSWPWYYKLGNEDYLKCRDILRILHYNFMKNEGHIGDIPVFSVTYLEIKMKLDYENFTRSLNLLRANREVQMQSSYVNHDEKVNFFYILDNGKQANLADKYKELFDESVNKKFKWLSNFLTVSVPLASFLISYVALDRSDTTKLNIQIERQQAQIDSLKKALEPKPVFKPAGPYRQK